jgi:hypothetical protein
MEVDLVVNGAIMCEKGVLPTFVALNTIAAGLKVKPCGSDNGGATESSCAFTTKYKTIMTCGKAQTKNRPQRYKDSD